ncbi:hypothetical protein C8R45DRAFT_551203 [Mycena sanguinolenta]|nr:hypothetical protein C8R45DRAFT_551203 [Mycena sanguinolenta]
MGAPDLVLVLILILLPAPPVFLFRIIFWGRPTNITSLLFQRLPSIQRVFGFVLFCCLQYLWTRPSISAHMHRCTRSRSRSHSRSHHVARPARFLLRFRFRSVPFKLSLFCSLPLCYCISGHDTPIYLCAHLISFCLKFLVFDLNITVLLHSIRARPRTSRPTRSCSAFKFVLSLRAFVALPLPLPLPTFMIIQASFPADSIQLCLGLRLVWLAGCVRCRLRLRLRLRIPTWTWLFSPSDPTAFSFSLSCARLARPVSLDPCPDSEHHIWAASRCPSLS